MQTKTLHASSVEELFALLQKTITSSFNPTLAIVFASVHHSLPTIQAMFRDAGVDIFGASSSGEILENSEDTNVYEESIVAMLFEIPRDAYRLTLVDGHDMDSYMLGQIVGSWVHSETFDLPAVLLMTSGMMTDGEQVIRGVIAANHAKLPIYGGMAGDDLAFKETFVFDTHYILGNSAIALVFNLEKINVQGVASSGWKAVGGEKKITKSQGNVVFQIDDQPATQIYRDYLGFTEQSRPELAPQYPLRIIRPEGYSVMRASMVVDFQNECVVYAGSVPEGSMVKFCSAPGVEITDHTLHELGEFHDQKAPQADALILFSCKGRHLALGPMAEDEVRPIQELWGAPLIGFYTYGEIGNIPNHGVDFHNETCVLVTLKEN